ncbi:hypothetical protein ACIA5G_29595 [Amycolatopsis sp. NPDC051758]|uniref:hypothetical protein n=1 Tax=Amycolatopsis sp. NPDC051758 TaxID=3363935 RepID=UPI0037A78E96
MDGFDLLAEAIRAVPVPGAPPRLSLDGAAVGLSFLDTALRLNHVRRLTERISLVEHRVALRTTEVDIRLGMLDEGQVRASDLFRGISGHALLEGRRSDSLVRRERPYELWVPMATIARTAAPVDVRDASGRKLPRLTQYETSWLLASGLYRLLRGILTGLPEAQRDTPLGSLLYQDHEPRWLIQAALLALLTDRSGRLQPTTRGTTQGMVAGQGQESRETILRLLGETYREQLSDYFELLHVAVNNYLLVVALDRGADEHLLTYDSPLNARKPRQWSWLAGLRTSSRGYLVRYEGTIPAGLRSYHLVVETEPGVDIEHMYLSTDADEALAGELTRDMEVLSDRLRERSGKPTADPSGRIMELQTQVTLRRLADLLRRRRWDAGYAGFDLNDDRLPGTVDLSWAAVSGEATPVEGAAHDDDSLVRHRLVSPTTLIQASGELKALQLGRDLATDVPVSNQGSVYWRRRVSRSAGGAQTTSAGISLRDSTPSSPATVFWYALCVAAISYATAAFAVGDWWPYWGSGGARLETITNPGALIAVLLLVPGFLYTRLPLPDRHSIAGQLRALPRLAAHLCIGCMAILCAAIAANLDPGLVLVAFFLATVLPALASVVLLAPLVAAWNYRKNQATMPEKLHLIGAPHWVDGRADSAGNVREPDVVFPSSGSLS